MSDGTGKTFAFAGGRLRAGASAVMVLATCVGARAATLESAIRGAPSAPLAGRAPLDLVRAARAGVRPSAGPVGLALARQAAHLIRAADRVWSFPLQVGDVLEANRRLGADTPELPARFRVQLDPGRSHRQPRAP